MSGSDEQLLLPTSLVVGLIMAVVGSKVNAAEAIERVYVIHAGGRTLHVSDFWGKQDKILKECRA